MAVRTVTLKAATRAMDGGVVYDTGAVFDKVLNPGDPIPPWAILLKDITV